MSHEKSQTELLTDISLKLDSILAFLALKIPQNEQNALVDKLSKSGLSTDAIARVVGITENAAAIRLSRLRKKSGKARRHRSRDAEKVTTDDKSSAEEGVAG